MTQGLPSPTFWRNKRVFLTGHTGFKGAWAALWLAEMGAEVSCLSLPPQSDPSLSRLHVRDVRGYVFVNPRVMLANN